MSNSAASTIPPYRTKDVLAQERLDGQVYLILVVQVDQKLQVLHLVGNILPQRNVRYKSPLLFVISGRMRALVLSKKRLFVGIIRLAVILPRRSSLVQ